ncbi:MAG: hypothetical protein LBD03_04395 [Methanobrevibacter sp.]|nr:hypothetical protein [Candidatus Methanovirga procula]
MIDEQSAMEIYRSVPDGQILCSALTVIHMRLIIKDLKKSIFEDIVISLVEKTSITSLKTLFTK